MDRKPLFQHQTKPLNPRELKSATANGFDKQHLVSNAKRTLSLARHEKLTNHHFQFEEVTLILECPDCESKVDAVEIADVKYDHFLPYRVTLAKCPSCSSALVAGQDYNPDGWDPAIRLWPPRRTVERSIPDVVKASLEEADRCFSAGAYTASAVMCGRALEAICIEKKTKNKTLVKALKELLEIDIIDQRLFMWGDELRKVRNLSAHATDENVSRQDANDLLDFLHAICDYIYVLNLRFTKFMQRRGGTTPTKKQTP